MITKDQIIEIHLTKPWIAIAMRQARAFTDAELPSNIRHVESRGSTEDEDALTGHFAHIAVAKHLWGYDGVNQYIHACEKANMLPLVRKVTGDKYISDNGEDFINLGLDVKASLIRTSQEPINHNSPVRPREWHPNIIYVQCLVRISRAPKATAESRDPSSFAVDVYICGWQMAEAYKAKGESEGGVFKGAYVIPIKELNPMMPMLWRT